MALAYAPPSPGAAGTSSSEASAELPYLADNAELIGQYEGSGFHEAPYIAKRGDGQVIQISHLLFLVASALHDEGDPEAVARRVSEDFGRHVSADNIVFLVDKKLRPTGLLATPESEAYRQRANPLLALRLRLPLVPEHIHRRVTTALTPLFRPAVWIAAVVAMLGLDAWLLTHVRPNILMAAGQLIYHPQLLLPLTLLTVAMGSWHETGHATAARYGGANPGAMGAGIYLIWPVFYTDVTDSYRLDRRGRLRVDLGGIYFNVLFMLVVGAAYAATGYVLFLVFLVLAHTETLRQFLPFVRLDGYYIVSDLAGVPNLFAYLKPALAQVTRFRRRRLARHAPGRSRAARAAHPTGADRPGHGLEALTRRARIMLTVWACITVPVLLANIVLLVFFAPRLAGAAWGSGGRQLRVIGYSFEHADVLGFANGLIGLLFLVLPAAGMAYIVVRMASRVPGVARRSWAVRPAVTGVVGAALGTFLLFQVCTVWPAKFTAAAQLPEPRSARPQASLDDPATSGAGGLAVAGSHLAWGAAQVAAPIAPPAPSVPLPAEPPAAPAPAPEPPLVEDEPDPEPVARSAAPTPAPAPGDGQPSAGPAPNAGAARPAGAPGVPAPPAPSTTVPPTTAPPTTTPAPTTPPTTAPASALDPLRELLPFLPE